MIPGDSPRVQTPIQMLFKLRSGTSFEGKVLFRASNCFNNYSMTFKIERRRKHIVNRFFYMPMGVFRNAVVLSLEKHMPFQGWRRQKGHFSDLSIQKYSLFFRPIQKKIGLFKLAQPVHYAYILYWIHYVIMCSSVRALQCFIQPYN